MSDAHTQALEQVRDHLSAARDHLDEDRPMSARRRIGLARGIVDRELEALAAANPTGAMGAQTSDGQSPRTAQEWAQRLFSPGRTDRARRQARVAELESQR